MNRRSFIAALGAAVGGIALEQAIPFNRVWSFPSKLVISGPCSVRFVKAYDLQAGRMMNRLDVLYGVSRGEVPRAVEHCRIITVPRESAVPEAIEEMKRSLPGQVPEIPEEMLARSSSSPELRGLQWYSDGLRKPVVLRVIG